mmetsp:Transcript_29068/g.61862  ORF Transcript_29068/g.61862 Transcript_29068/m.61862 type:complete len:86 (-) Transcript_29068:651-908(-)
MTCQLDQSSSSSSLLCSRSRDVVVSEPGVPARSPVHDAIPALAIEPPLALALKHLSSRISAMLSVHSFRKATQLLTRWYNAPPNL